MAISEIRRWDLSFDRDEYLKPYKQKLKTI
jgi:hypothetical protein